MANKMLIDATHPEETRVVVLRGNRVEEFDFESAHRKQLRGNIYLAKVTRVEPSLQAAFVDYGGNRHGFLAFSEIHPDYYQIPVADRQALIDEESRAQRAADDEDDRRANRTQGRRRGRGGPRPASRRKDVVKSEPITEGEHTAEEEFAREEADFTVSDIGHDVPLAAEAVDATPDLDASTVHARDESDDDEGHVNDTDGDDADDEAPADEETHAEDADGPVMAESGSDEQPHEAAGEAAEPPTEEESAEPAEVHANGNGQVAEVNGNGAEGETVESMGGSGDALEELPERAARPRRQYKIQEVIKRRQVMLVQVVKEERGTKGAALTTYLSLAGRYSVLMPNTARGGGISRKITQATDRKRLKEVAEDLEVPEGMGVILRTAGASRTKTEIKRDFEYLLRLWETVRDLTLKSTAPMLVYEEGSLVKRSIRDLYNKDIDEILVAGEEGYREAKDFMRMLMPSHAKHVKLYKDTTPLFARHAIENQLDAMFSPVVQLKSGGYLVLNQAEALVAIDVNSGRATREHHIEDTALKTNSEAAEEISRQLRLRDLAGLIVIDFIDMDEKRNNRSVERKLKECLKNDRARIQVGHISHFGLLEMSRQRIRSSVLESSTEKCPHCGGTGHVRSVASVTLQLLRALEETLLKGATHNLIVRTRPEIALYVLNHKRAHLRALEERFRVTLTVNADAAIGAQPSFVVDKGEQVHTLEQAKALALQPAAAIAEEPAEAEEMVAEELEAEAAEAEGQPAREGERSGRRRRRGRRGGRREESGESGVPAEEAEGVAQAAEGEEGEPIEEGAEPAGERANGNGERRRRRRGRRGGRRNRRTPEEAAAAPAGDDWPVEPEVTTAVADMGGPPPEHEHGVHEVSIDAVETALEDIAEESEFAPAEPTPEPSRRRSTVREPAVPGVATEHDYAPAASNTPSSAGESEEESDQPRRSGWWSRRLLSDRS